MTTAAPAEDDRQSVSAVDCGDCGDCVDCVDCVDGATEADSGGISVFDGDDELQRPCTASYRGVRIVFEDAADARALTVILWALTLAAYVALGSLCVLAMSTDDAPVAVLRHACMVLLLDVASAASFLLGFGAMYVGLITPRDTFHDITGIFVTGICIDNVVGSLLTCMFAPIEGIMASDLDTRRLYATMAEAVLHFNLAPFLGVENLNPCMWLHYVMIAVGSIALVCRLPGDERRGVHHKHVASRLWAGALTLLVFAHVARCVASTSTVWFAIAETTIPLYACEVGAGCLVAYGFVAVDCRRRVQAASRAWLHRTRVPTALVLAACWVSEVGRRVSPETPGAACLSAHLPCVSSVLVFLPRSWLLVASALSSAVAKLPGQCESRGVDLGVGPINRNCGSSCDLESDTYSAASETVQMIHTIGMVTPCVALTWPLMQACRLLLRLVGALETVGGSCGSVVVWFLLARFLIAAYTVKIRTQLAMYVARCRGHAQAWSWCVYHRACCRA